VPHGPAGQAWAHPHHAAPHASAAAEAISQSRRQVAQRLAVHAAFGPAAAVPVQRKIHVKDGKKYDSVSQGINAPRLKAIAESPAIYLVKSQDDINLMKQNQDAPVLAPRKHLIGEVHNASQFTTAVGDWAWGAQLLIEPYGTHGRLVDSQQAQKRKAPTGDANEQTMWVQAKALEDTAAKSLTNLANARIFGTKMATLAGRLQTPSTFAAIDKLELKTRCTDAWHKLRPALTAANELASYLLASAEERGLGFIGKYFNEHALVKQTVTTALINEIAEGLDNVKAQVDTQATSQLAPAKIAALLTHVDALIPVFQRLVVSYDPAGYKLSEIQQATTNALQNKDIGELDSLRERYMRQQIDAAGVPALVKIGAQHVVHLSNNLPAHAEAFADYTAFRDKNTAANVDV
jgi:hypothetical protein